ncbi:Receptor kinase-like protein Xa21, processed [Actinidia chinensis var. chinensis]|uniref:non-specific serine/threonine protein kinase n=1 Tax=Actinidia chinensis var. chinensis TaxID=1590841 RepID=A0A2R6R2F4_ACTCC|nr:Receptor kinase-like protein Xa21, processed [Actinidia chinensis var. chinensis]
MEKTSFMIAAVVLLVNNSLACLAVTSLTTDQSALLAFKAHITSDPSGVLAKNWSTTASVCHWIGVSCGVLQQRVIALNLSHMGLTGTLSPHLGNLSFLALLGLSFNHFHGQIPEDLGSLHQLEGIYLGYNNFSGDVPSWIGNFSNLKLLDLKYNQLTGSIPYAIFNMSSLQRVDLTSNGLYGSLPEDICDHVSKLEGLFLSLNRLYGRIPSSLYKCRDLQYLSLSFNNFNGSIPREIGNLTMLKELYIGNNDLKGVIPSEIGNLANLEIVSVRSGSLTGSIPSFIFNISSLRIIDLTNNNLSGSIPMDIHYDLPFLEELYLTSNQLSGQFPPGLWECKGLRSLSLSVNKFTGSISRKIGNLTLLRDLYLGNNNLTGALPEEIGKLNLEKLSIQEASLTGLIPFQIFNMSTVRIIDLGLNQLSGQLPLSLGLWLPNLEQLYLGDNKLSGIITSSIGNASKLTILSLTTNSFTGSIPNTIGDLRFLRVFLASQNNLTRESSSRELSFFTSLANCRHLKYLGISLNQFNGILPASFGNLSTTLQRLEAFGCNLMGDFPSGIGNLSSLEVITLDSNELTGFLPETLGRLKLLERLYLEHNRLQGSIPNDLCLLNKLGDIYLSDNKLHGPIPTCLGEHKPLRSLYLDSNNLTGTIPLTLWSLTDLIGLNLSTNSLRGYIPLEIGRLKVITQIDLSWNQLSGDIPSTIGGAQTLVTLSLAHNKLQGPIPQLLGDLINLEFLDLSNNNLSGGIPKSLEALRYLQYLNLSFNRLQGEIPTGGHFANFTAQSFMQNEGLCGAPRFQVPLCRTSRTTYLDFLKYILPSIAAAILVAVLIFVLIRFRKQKKQLPPSQVDPSTRGWKVVAYQELGRATDAFNESNLLGSGSFGSVYKGTLSDGMTVAIKVFNLQAEGAFKSFNAECEVMCNVRHRNLLQVISSCSNVDFKALVLEYMPNGSLEQWLYSHNYFLDVLQRLNIMIDIVSAMEYLHHGLPSPIVHCDLKPSNVLLDEDMVAHVGDFGIAKLLGEGEYMSQTKTLATIGYMAPEYGTEGIISTGGDVYSYGILLMEVFTRKRPTDEMFTGEMSFKRWVSELLRDGSVLFVVDSNLIGSEDENFSAKEQCVLSVFHLALACSKDSPKERINMKDAAAMIEKIKIEFLENIGKDRKDKLITTNSYRH